MGQITTETIAMIRRAVDANQAPPLTLWEFRQLAFLAEKQIEEQDGCPHGNAFIVNDCLRCGAPVCCGKCCAEDPSNVAGEIAYQLTKRLVIDMPTARAAVDAALAGQKQLPAVTQWQKRHENIDDGRWQNTNEADAKWWRDNSKGWEIRTLFEAQK